MGMRKLPCSVADVDDEILIWAEEYLFQGV